MYFGASRISGATPGLVGLRGNPVDGSLEGRVAAGKERGAVEGNDLVWHDPFAFEADAGFRDEIAERTVEGVAIGESLVNGGEGLAGSGAAKDARPAEFLQAPGEDFGGASGGFIDENGDGAGVGLHALAGRADEPGIDEQIQAIVAGDEGAEGERFGEEMAGNADDHADDPADVAAEVDNDAIGLAMLLDSMVEGDGGGEHPDVEANQADARVIANGGGIEIGIKDREAAELDGLAGTEDARESESDGGRRPR